MQRVALDCPRVDLRKTRLTGYQGEKEGGWREEEKEEEREGRARASVKALKLVIPTRASAPHRAVQDKLAGLRAALHPAASLKLHPTPAALRGCTAWGLRAVLSQQRDFKHAPASGTRALSEMSVSACVRRQAAGPGHQTQPVLALGRQQQRYVP